MQASNDNEANIERKARVSIYTWDKDGNRLQNATVFLSQDDLVEQLQTPALEYIRKEWHPDFADKVHRAFYSVTMDYPASELREFERAMAEE